MYIEPLAMHAELITKGGDTAVRGMLQLSVTQQELEFRSEELPHLACGSAVEIITYTEEGIFSPLACEAAFSTPRVLGLEKPDKEGFCAVKELLYQNISVKFFAEKGVKKGLFSKNEPIEIQICRIEPQWLCFISIEELSDEQELCIDIQKPINLKNLRITTNRRIYLNKLVNLYFASFTNLSAANREEIMFFYTKI